MSAERIAAMNSAEARALVAELGLTAAAEAAVAALPPVLPPEALELLRQMRAARRATWIVAAAKTTASP